MNWEDELKKSICSVGDLEGRMSIGARQRKQLQHVTEIHPMRITPYYASLIDWSDPDDPLMRMAVPSPEEFDVSGSYDTSGELLSTKMPGLQHKYAQTALILTTNRCALYCRYCFRKRLVGLPTDEVLQRFNDAARYIERHKEINNVLLSGGDPLILPTRLIRRFLQRLSQVHHLNSIRLGSRVPVTFPSRILTDPDLISLLREQSHRSRRLYLVSHLNHPREITPKSTAAFARLIGAGMIVINQTILLKGVNDDPATLAKLNKAMVRIGVNPYYVFQCRPVKRVKRHFQVSLKRGYDIVEGAKAMLDGPSKRFRYIMSHRSGKIEIVGVTDDEIYLKYHQARNPKNLGKFFKRKLTADAGWLDDLPKAGQY
jgi:lysine 2,3-aminomutase